MDNLWQFDLDDSQESKTENAIQIIKEQTQFLKEKTNNRVKAKFGKIKDISFGASLSALSQGFKKEEIIDVDAETTHNLTDANKLYKPVRYGFEIYNEQYRFRVFEAEVPLYYPLTIYPDEDICKDISANIDVTNYKIIINSDEQLIETLKEILTSEKLIIIVRKLNKGQNN